MTTVNARVGETAGRIWRHLAAEGEQPVEALAKALGEEPGRVFMAVGWLAREDKVQLRKRGKTYHVTLRANAESW